MDLRSAGHALRSSSLIVMAGLVPAIHGFLPFNRTPRAAVRACRRPRKRKRRPDFRQGGVAEALEEKISKKSLRLYLAGLAATYFPKP
jgi:hypothetical protein